MCTYNLRYFKIVEFKKQFTLFINKMIIMNDNLSKTIKIIEKV